MRTNQNLTLTQKVGSAVAIIGGTLFGLEARAEDKFGVPKINGGYHTKELPNFHSNGYPGYRDIKAIEAGDLECEIVEVSDRKNPTVLVLEGYHTKDGKRELRHRQEVTFDKAGYPVRVTTSRSDVEEQAPTKISDYFVLRVSGSDKFAHFVRVEAHDDKSANGQGGPDGLVDSFSTWGWAVKDGKLGLKEYTSVVVTRDDKGKVTKLDVDNGADGSVDEVVISPKKNDLKVLHELEATFDLNGNE